MPKVNSKTYVYHPRDFKRANRYLASGRLRPLAEALLRRDLRRLRERPVKRRPLNWRKRHPGFTWPHYAWSSIPRNGHQSRRRQQLRDALRTLRRLRSAAQQARQ
jgi:hypothetical protein